MLGIVSATERDRIQVLQKTMDILRLLAEGPSSVREISDRTGVTKPAVYRILHTLEEQNFVERDELRREYILGNFLTELSRRHDQAINLPRIIKPYMEALQKKFNETVNLGVIEGDKIKYLYSIESSQRLRYGNSLQERDNVHSTALGKALLSAYKENELPKILRNLHLETQTDKTITSERELLSALNRARKIGFAIDDQENELGARCVAVAISDRNGNPVCAISVTGPASRMTTERIRIIGDNLKAIAKQLSSKIE